MYYGIDTITPRLERPRQAPGNQFTLIHNTSGRPFFSDLETPVPCAGQERPGIHQSGATQACAVEHSKDSGRIHKPDDCGRGFFIYP